MSMLCKIGLHKPDNYNYLIVRFQKGRHKWQRSYVICERCGKRIASFRRRKLQ